MSWEKEVIGKTFVPGSDEEKLVEQIVERIKWSGKDLKEIVTVAVWDAQKLLADRIKS